MTDGSRRNKDERIRLVAVDDRAKHESRVQSMRNHPTSVKAFADIRLIIPRDDLAE